MDLGEKTRKAVKFPVFFSNSLPFKAHCHNPISGYPFSFTLSSPKIIVYKNYIKPRLEWISGWRPASVACQCLGGMSRRHKRVSVVFRDCDSAPTYLIFTASSSRNPLEVPQVLAKLKCLSFPNPILVSSLKLFSPSKTFYILLLAVEKTSLILGSVQRLPLPLPWRTMVADVLGGCH